MFEEKDIKKMLNITLGIMNIIFILVIIYLYFNSVCQSEPIIKKNIIIVQIAGEVNKPGIYEIEDGMRLNDLIKLSGGFTDKANIDAVNLALKISDEMKVLIPSYETSSDQQNKLININTADVSTLMTLNGIGEVKAQEIILHREKYGYFKSIDEIIRVSGIGEITFEKIKDYICI